MLTCFVLQIVLLKKSSVNLGAVLILFVCCVYYVHACLCVASVWRLEDNTHTSWFSVCGYEGSNSGQRAWQRELLLTEPSKYIVLDLHRPVLIRKQALWHSAWSENRILPCSQCWMIKRFPLFKKSHQLEAWHVFLNMERVQSIASLRYPNKWTVFVVLKSFLLFLSRDLCLWNSMEGYIIQRPPSE